MTRLTARIAQRLLLGARTLTVAELAATKTTLHEHAQKPPRGRPTTTDPCQHNSVMQRTNQRPLADMVAHLSARHDDNTTSELVRGDGRVWCPSRLRDHHGSDLPGRVFFLRGQARRPKRGGAFQLSPEPTSASVPHFFSSPMCSVRLRVCYMFDCRCELEDSSAVSAVSSKKSVRAAFFPHLLLMRCGVW